MGIILSLCNAGAAHYAGKGEEVGSSSSEESWVEICKVADEEEDQEVVVGSIARRECSPESAEKYVARGNQVEVLRSEVPGLERKHFRSVHPMMQRRRVKPKDFEGLRPIDRNKMLEAAVDPAKVAAARTICPKDIELVGCGNDDGGEPSWRGETSKSVQAGAQQSNQVAMKLESCDKKVVDDGVRAAMAAPRPSSLYRKAHKSPARVAPVKIEPACKVVEPEAVAAPKPSSLHRKVDKSPARVAPVKIEPASKVVEPEAVAAPKPSSLHRKVDKSPARVAPVKIEPTCGQVVAAKQADPATIDAAIAIESACNVVAAEAVAAPRPSSLYRKAHKSPARVAPVKIEPTCKAEPATIEATNAADPAASTKPTKAKCDSGVSNTESQPASSAANGLASFGKTKVQELQVHKPSEIQLSGDVAAKKAKGVRKPNTATHVAAVAVEADETSEPDGHWKRVLKLLEKRATRRTLPPLKKKRRGSGTRRLGSISGGSTVLSSGKPVAASGLLSAVSADDNTSSSMNLEQGPSCSKDGSGELDNQGVPVKKKRARKKRKGKVAVADVVGANGEANIDAVGGKAAIDPAGLQSDAQPGAADDGESISNNEGGGKKPKKSSKTKKEKNSTNPEVDGGKRGSVTEAPAVDKSEEQKSSKKKKKSRKKGKVGVEFSSSEPNPEIQEADYISSGGINKPDLGASGEGKNVARGKKLPKAPEHGTNAPSLDEGEGTSSQDPGPPTSSTTILVAESNQSSEPITEAGGATTSSQVNPEPTSSTCILVAESTSSTAKTSIPEPPCSTSTILLVAESNQSCVPTTDTTSTSAELGEPCTSGAAVDSSAATSSELDPATSVGETSTTTKKGKKGKKDAPTKGPSVGKMMKSALQREVLLLSSHGRPKIVPDLVLETGPKYRTGTDEENSRYIYSMFEGKSKENRGYVEVLSMDKENHEEEQIVEDWEFTPKRTSNEPRPYEGATHPPSKWSKLKFWRNKTVVQKVGLECKKSCWDDEEEGEPKKKVKGEKKPKEKKKKVNKEDKVKSINIAAPSKPSTSRVPDDGLRAATDDDDNASTSFQGAAAAPCSRPKPSDMYRKVGSVKLSDVYRRSPNTSDHDVINAPGTPEVVVSHPNERCRKAMRPPTRAGNRAAQGMATNRIVSQPITDDDFQPKVHKSRVDHAFAHVQAPHITSPSRPSDLYRKALTGSDNGPRTGQMSSTPRPSSLYRKVK